MGASGAGRGLGRGAAEPSPQSREGAGLHRTHCPTLLWYVHHGRIHGTRSRGVGGNVGRGPSHFSLLVGESPGSFSDGCHPDSHMPSGPSPPSLAVPCVPCPTPRWRQHATTLHTPQMPCLCHKLLSSFLEGPGPPCHPVLQDLFVVSAPKGRDFFHCFHTPSPPAGLWDKVKTLGHSTRDWLLRPIKTKEHWLAGSRAPSTELAPGSPQGSG